MCMKRSAGNLTFACLLLGPVLVAAAGDDPSLRSDDRLPTPVDARVADVSPLARSLRVESPGLGIPSGFSAVYRVPGDPDGLMRVNGGLTALFPQSVYQTTSYGSFPVIPAATVFRIGTPSTLPAESGSPPRRPAVAEPAEHEGFARAGFGYVPETTGPAAVTSGSDRLPRFVRDADYRRGRLAAILRSRLESRARVGKNPPAGP